MEVKRIEDEFDNEFLDVIFNDKVFEWSEPRVQRFNKLMAYYRCAMMEIETKFNVLNEEFSLQYDRNPISSIKSRLKSVKSMANKLKKAELPFTLTALEENLNDVAGV